MNALNITSAIKNMKMKLKFMLMLSVPLLALAYFSGSEIIQRIQSSREMSNVAQLSDLAVRASNLIHELQKERGQTAGYMGSKGQKFSSELAAQRDDTDAKLRVLDDYLAEFEASQFGSEFEALLMTATGKLANLKSRRQNISALDVAAGEALGYYTSTIGSLIKTFGYMASLTRNASVSNRVITILNLVEAKERSGVERAVLNVAFSADAFGPGMYKKFIALVAAQETFLSGFATTASREYIQLLDSKMNDPSVAEVEKMRLIAEENAAVGNFGIDPGYWFKTITSKINLYKQVEDELTADLAAYTTRSAVVAKRAIGVYSLVIAVSFIISILIAIMVTRAVLAYLERLKVVTKAVATGNLMERVEIESEDELGDVGRAVDTMINDLVKLVVSLKASSNQVGQASGQISTASEQLAAGSEEQQAQLSEVATTMEEMSAMIVESSNTADATRDNAQATSTTAIEGRETVSKTVTGFKKVASTVETAAKQIKELDKRSEEIGNVIQVIDDIADQTNLLALNANIEAARAGDAGRGFAVVADEVRKLAERTVTATSEIGQMIESIQNDIKVAVDSMDEIQTLSLEGLELVSESDTALGNISASVSTIVGAIDQIATSSGEQSSGVEEISKNIEGVSSVAKQSASSAQELAASAEKLNREVQGLDELIAQFIVD